MTRVCEHFAEKKTFVNDFLILADFWPIRGRPRRKTARPVEWGDEFFTDFIVK
jgi:hypothetical protein